MIDIKNNSVFTDAYQRAIGVFIVLKVSFPIIFLSFILYGLGSIYYGIKGAYDEAYKQLEPHLKTANDQIEAIQNEVKRLNDEVKKIEKATDKIKGTVEKSVEPIRKSLLGLSLASRTLIGTLKSIVNIVYDIINKFRLKKAPNLKIPNISVPKISFPDFDLDISLQPNMALIKEFQGTALKIAEIADITINGIKGIYDSFILYVQIGFYLIAVWLMLSLVGIFVRGHQRLCAGLRLIKGEKVAYPLALF